MDNYVKYLQEKLSIERQRMRELGMRIQRQNARIDWLLGLTPQQSREAILQLRARIRAQKCELEAVHQNLQASKGSKAMAEVTKYSEIHRSGIHPRAPEIFRENKIQELENEICKLKDRIQEQDDTVARLKRIHSVVTSLDYRYLCVCNTSTKLSETETMETPTPRRRNSAPDTQARSDDDSQTDIYEELEQLVERRDALLKRITDVRRRISEMAAMRENSM